MLGCVYQASCTKNVIGSVNRRKTAKINVQFSLPKIWRTRGENNKMGLFVISPHLIFSRKETPQGSGKIILKHSPGPKRSLCSTRKCVLTTSSPCLLINISPDHIQLAQNPYLLKLPCELTVFMVSWTPRAKMWDIYANREMFLINITPKTHSFSPMPDENISLSSITLCLLRAINFWSPPVSFWLPTLRKHTLVGSYSLPKIFCVPKWTPYLSHAEKVWRTEDLYERHNIWNLINM